MATTTKGSGLKVDSTEKVNTAIKMAVLKGEDGKMEKE
jgi:hypothetical protein